MKKTEVPQDDSFLDGHRKAAYAVDEQGKYSVVPSRGYEPERVATSLALEAQDEALRHAWEQVNRKERSPLAYYMTLRQLNPSLLANHVGIATWRVRRHLSPSGFTGMSLRLALKYCETLAINIDKFLTVPDKPESLAELPVGDDAAHG